MKKLSLKRLSVVLVIVVLMGSMLTYGAPRRMAIVTEVKGTVKIKKSGGERKINAFKGMNLAEGDTLIIGYDGQMTLKLDDDKEVILNANTTMNIQDLKEKNGDQVTTLNQTKGSSVTKIDNKLTAGSSFQQRTPTAIMGVRGTVWSSQQNEEGTTTVVVGGVVGVSGVLLESDEPDGYIRTSYVSPYLPLLNDLSPPSAPPAPPVPQAPPVPPASQTPQAPQAPQAPQTPPLPPPPPPPPAPQAPPVPQAPLPPQGFQGPQGLQGPQVFQGSGGTEIVVESGQALQSVYRPTSTPAPTAIDWNSVNPVVIQNFASIAAQSPSSIDPNAAQGLQDYIGANPQVLERQQPETVNTRVRPSYAPLPTAARTPASAGGGGGGGGGSPLPTPPKVTTAEKLVEAIKSNMTVTNNAASIQASLKRVFIGVESEAIDMQSKLQSFLGNTVIPTAPYGTKDNFFVFRVQGMGTNLDEEWELFIFRDDETGDLNKDQLYGVGMKYGDDFLNGVTDSETNDSTIIVPDNYVFPEENDSDGIKAINEGIHLISYPTTTVELTGEVMMDEEERPCYRGTFNVNNGKNTYYVTVRKAYTDAGIDEFTIGGQLGGTRFATNEETGDPTIEVYMPEDTDLDQVIPKVTTLKGASYTLSSTDFSQPVTCTVTAEDGKTSNIYTVRVYPYGEPRLLTVTVIDENEREFTYEYTSQGTSDSFCIPAGIKIGKDSQGDSESEVYYPNLSVTCSTGANLIEDGRVYPASTDTDKKQVTVNYKVAFPNEYGNDNTWQITLVRDMFTAYRQNEQGDWDDENPILSGQKPTISLTTSESLYIKKNDNDFTGIYYSKKSDSEIKPTGESQEISPNGFSQNTAGTWILYRGWWNENDSPDYIIVEFKERVE